MSDQLGLSNADHVDSADFARELASIDAHGDRLSVGVGLIAEMVSGCDHVGITQITRSGLVNIAATDDVARIADRWQYELREGPCVTTVRDHQTVLSLDLSGDRRWPRWAPLAVEELGIKSMLSLLLYTHERAHGAVNLYAAQTDAFTPDDLSVAKALAAHLAVAVVASEEIAHLGVAITNRTVIGQAEGILMERLQISADQAFDYLRRVSQDTNTKLVQVAARLVHTRVLPGE